MAKVGLSFSRCLRDIADGIVDVNDVLIIIARTDFDPRDDKQWGSIWEGYGYGEWYKAYSQDGGAGEVNSKYREIAIDLLTSGRLHQPRQFGTYEIKRDEYWLETVLPSSELDKNPAAKAAWEKFQMVAGLTNVELDEKYR